MSTLNEKFCDLIDNDNGFDNQLHADRCEKIADDYAIEFLKFTEGTYSFGNILGKWYLFADTSKDYTTKELLEIFKNK